MIYDQYNFLWAWPVGVRFLSLHYAFNNSDKFIFLAHEFIIFIDVLVVGVKRDH